jgi:predicted SnoaL-like aldol condensation-catalyzing enzyme
VAHHLEPNKTLVRHLYERLMANGDVAAAEEILDDAYVDHSLPGNIEGGRAELIGVVQAVRAAVPDIAPSSIRRSRKTTSSPSGSLRAVTLRVRHSHQAFRRRAERSSGASSTSSGSPAVASSSTGESSTTCRSSSSSVPCRRPADISRSAWIGLPAQTAAGSSLSRRRVRRRAHRPSEPGRTRAHEHRRRQ